MRLWDFMNSPPVKLGWSIDVFCVHPLVFLSLSYFVHFFSHSTFCHPLICSAVWMWLIPKSCCGRHNIYAGTNQVPIWRFLFLTIACSSTHQCFIIAMVSQHQKYMYFILWNFFFTWVTTISQRTTCVWGIFLLGEGGGGGGVFVWRWGKKSDQIVNLLVCYILRTAIYIIYGFGFFLFIF